MELPVLHPQRRRRARPVHLLGRPVHLVRSGPNRRDDRSGARDRERTSLQCELPGILQRPGRSTRDAKGDLESARQPGIGEAACPGSRRLDPEPAASQTCGLEQGTSTVLPCAWGSLLETAREPALADSRTASSPTPTVTHRAAVVFISPACRFARAPSREGCDRVMPARSYLSS